MNAAAQLRLITVAEAELDETTNACANVLRIPNDVDPLTLCDSIAAASRIELDFPHFTDGRAFSQAYLVRRRLRFTGDLRATGDVLADQLIQMARTGFSSAVLQDGVDRADARRQLARFAGFYQGDVGADAPFRAAPTD
jgi:uncharacterized protein (DUF934 family)